MKKFVKPTPPEVTHSGNRAGTRFTNWARSCAKVVSIATASAAIGLSTQAADIVTGIVKREVWNGSDRLSIENGLVGTPSEVTFQPTFEAPSDVADNYAQRMTGVFIPATSGNYNFVISSDDDSDLFLSTDSTSANKRLIAQQPGWNATRKWVGDAGGTTANPKRDSSTWTDASGATPWAAGIPLVAGQAYFIQAVMHEGGGGDNLGVAAYLKGTPAPVDDDDAAIVTEQIGIRVPSSLTVAISPGNTTAQIGTAVRFKATLTPPASEIDDNITFHWHTNGVEVAGVTGANYSTPILDPSLNNLKVDVSVTLEHGAATAASAQSTVTVPATGNTVVSGFLKWEYFPGASRTDVENGAVGAPAWVRNLTSFEAPHDFADNYASRISGYFTPAVSGNYVFAVSSDDDSDLFLSTDENPSKKRLVAQQGGWNANREWQGDPPATAGDPDVAAPQRYSNTWVPDPAAPVDPTPYATGIPLTAGQRYYIEGVHHEGGGGDNFAATAYLIADSTPTNGAPSTITGSVIAYSTSPATTLTITTQPHSATTTETFSTNFVVAVSTDSAVEPTYQWKRNGVDIAGANSPSYGLVTAATDNNAVFSVVVTVPGTSLTVTSQNATLTVLSAKVETGYVKWEYFDEKTRPQVEDGSAGPATKTSAITIAEGPNGYDDNYASRISGLYTPPVDGDYVFFINSDDDSDLFLSTDDSPAKKHLIAQETGWSDARNWDGVNGIGNAGVPGDGSASDFKRSDFFPNTQWPTKDMTTGFAVITLSATKRYYFEAVQHEGGGGDNLEVTVVPAADGAPADSTPSSMTGTNIAILAAPAQSTITTQPVSTTIDEGTSATFSVAATTDSLFGLLYQWQRNGTDIAGATSASYTTPLQVLANSGDKYTVVVKALGANPVTSSQATLTVRPDQTPPVVIEAGAVKRGTGFEIGIGFNEPLDPTSAATAGNYTLSKGAVTAARYEPFDTPIDLTKPVIVKGAVVLATSGLAAGDTVNVTISNVKDAHNNPLAAPVVKSVAISGKMSWVGVGGNDYLDSDPSVPAAFADNNLVPANYYDDMVALQTDKDFDLISGSSANWANYDEATFVYEEITGDFDRIVRVEYQDATSQWGRAGIMARTSLDEGIGRAQIDATPQGAAMIIRVNPTVTWNGAAGNNSYEWVYRDTVGGSYANSGGGGTPAYPNAWMRLQRVAGVFTGYRSTDGQNWTSIGTHDWTAVVDAAGNPVDKVFVGPYYAPELNNADPNFAFLIGHSAVAKFRDYGPFGTLPVEVKISAITQAAGNITINWTGGGTLESTTALVPNGGTVWTSTGDTDGSFTEAIGTGIKFYRVKK
jgi:hypothetical protein